MLKKQRYNIALVPADAEVRENFIGISQAFFAAVEDQYILGSGKGVPHITLCQFYASSDQIALDAFNKINFPNNLAVDILDFRIKPGNGLINEGTFYAEYRVVPFDHLSHLQEQVVQTIELAGGEVLTSTKGYSPHFSLARFRKNPKILPTMDELLVKTKLRMQPVLGLSSEPGVLYDLNKGFSLGI